MIFLFYLQRRGRSFLPRFFEDAVSSVVEPLSSKRAFFHSELNTRPIRVLERLGAFSKAKGERDGSGIGIF